MAELKFYPPSFWYDCHAGHECHLDLSDGLLDLQLQEPRTRVLSCKGGEQQPLFNFAIRDKNFIY